MGPGPCGPEFSYATGVSGMIKSVMITDAGHHKAVIYILLNLILSIEVNIM